MSGAYVLYSDAGSGGVAVEAALALIGEPYELVESATSDPDAVASGDKVLAANPMRQVPALVLPSGELMTESAAILIWLADAHPEARLSPTMAGVARPAFLRWMSFVSAAIYGLFWVRDDPSRLVSATEGPSVKARTGERIVDCWRMMDAQVDPDRYILGDELTVLDLYVTVVSRWGPRRKRFYDVAPKMSDVVRRVDAEPRLAAFWAERFPFAADWEG